MRIRISAAVAVWCVSSAVSACGQAAGRPEELPASNAAIFVTVPNGGVLQSGQFGLYPMAGPEGRLEATRKPAMIRALWGEGIASDGRGRPGASSAGYSLETQPPAGQSWWFLALCAIAPAAIAYWFVRLRCGQMRQKEQDLLRLVDLRTAELRRTTSRLQEANRNLVRLSSLDGLTGITNRRVFDLMLEKEWERARRLGAPLAMVLADVDQFKRLNDLAGHQAGDECLRLIAQTLMSAARRGTDCVARFGGEEFALLLPGLDEEQALVVAEAARQSVEALEYPHLDSEAGIVTISLGVATLDGGNFSTERALVGAADEALYAAKRQGRNRVVSAMVSATAPKLTERFAAARGGMTVAEPTSVAPG